MTLARNAVVAPLIAVLLAACGGSDTTAEQTTEVAQEPNDAERYCSLSAELDAQDGPPSEEQLAEIERVAPPEISEQVATLVEAVRNQDFDNPDVAEAESQLLAWEEENCVESPEDEPGESGAEATDTATP